MLENKIILITGNGSFADSMIERLLKSNVKEIRVFSRNEENQWATEKKYNDNRIKLIIGDIKEYNSIYEAIKGCDYVLHSAALKHVPICEKQPIEAINTNVIGSQNVMIACINNNVKKLVCLSTDKSANASTCYGATKYLMERLALGIDNKNTEIILTRYGNVLGSSGSVIPLFKQLKQEGKPLTLTDPNMTRFFMSMEQALDLVIYALENGKHKDLIVFKNKSASVQMIADCISDNQVVVGTRPSEKTDEALLTKLELDHSEDLGKYYRIREDIINNEKHDIPLTSDTAEKFIIEELKELIERC